MALGAAAVVEDRVADTVLVRDWGSPMIGARRKGARWPGARLKLVERCWKGTGHCETEAGGGGTSWAGVLLRALMSGA